MKTGAVSYDLRPFIYKPTSAFAWKPSFCDALRLSARGREHHFGQVPESSPWLVCCGQ